MTKISLLPQDTAPTLTDYVPTVDVETGITKRSLLSALRDLIAANLPAASVTANNLVGLNLFGTGVGLAGSGAPPRLTGQFYIQASTFVGTTDASGNITIPFPVAFPNGVVSIVMTQGDNTISGAVFNVQAATVSNFVAHYGTANTNARHNFIAIGY